MSETPDLGRVECLVVGAGVIGLAVARAFALQGREVLVLEAESVIGTGTSSRNSEVVHGGLYYPPGSLKAELCVAGREQLYHYCASRGVPHRRLGKLVVAESRAELPKLEAIAERAAANGVDDLRLLEAGEMARMEPALNGSHALHSPSTGIVDSHAFMLSLQGEAEEAGAAFAFNAPVLGGRVGPEEVVLEIGGAQPCRIAADLMVNAAGLGAHRVAACLDGLPAHAVPAVRYAKGNYFALQGRAPFSRLIYPVPEPGGLGVHLTLDMGGQARFGPDVEWIDEPDYTVDPARAEPFYAAIRRYWPGLPDGALHPDYAGVRVKLPEGDQDFCIARPTEALFNLFGFESPGLTAALAVADRVAGMAAS